MPKAKAKITIHNWRNPPVKIPYNNPLPSKTEQNQTETIQEIIDKSASGIIDLDKERQGFYLDSDIHKIDKFFGSNLDLTDLKELSDRTKQLHDEVADEIEAKLQDQLLDAEIAKTTKEEELKPATKKKNEED